MSLFDAQLARKPNLYPWTQAFIDAMWKGFWTPNEFDFNADYGQFQQLAPVEQGVIVRGVSAIGQVEVAPKSFWANLGTNFPHPSMSDLGYVMSHSEVIHNLAYEKLLDRLHLTAVFEENLKNPVVKGRVDYLKKHNEKAYADDRKQYVFAIILFTLFVENVSLFSQFYLIRWLHRFHKIEKLLKDTSQQVQYTRLEELLHAQVGITLINTLRQELPDLFDAELQAKVLKECRSAFEAECKVIDWIIEDHEWLGRDQHGVENRLNGAVLKEYVKKRMNDSLVAIRFGKQFDEDPDIIAQTKWFDREVVLNTMTDFFAKKPIEYQKKAVSAGDLF